MFRCLEAKVLIQGLGCIGIRAIIKSNQVYLRVGPFIFYQINDDQMQERWENKKLLNLHLTFSFVASRYLGI